MALRGLRYRRARRKLKDRFLMPLANLCETLPQVEVGRTGVIAYPCSLFAGIETDQFQQALKVIITVVFNFDFAFFGSVVD